ncbi:MAG: LPS export ABC transporter periplasmic protein LptC [Holosporaceae bacterium]|nr:LPS export ABC transporter periplasmic protein LptC [Holosporaceae bacterium]
MRSRRTRIKLISIFFAVVAIGIFIVIIIFTAKTKRAISLENSPNPQKNFFSEIKFRTYDLKGKEINVKSESIYENKKNNYVFKNMVSNFTMPNGEILTISSDITNAIREDRMQCEFIGNVKLSTDSGLIMKTKSLFVDFNKKIAHGNTEVVISQDDTQVSGKKYFFDMNKNVLILTGNANGLLKSDRVHADMLVIRFNDMHEKNIKNIDAIGNATYTTKDYVLKAQKNILYSSNRIDAQSDAILLYKKNGNDYDIRSDSMQAEINNGRLDNIKTNTSLTIKTNNATIRADRGVLKDDIIEVLGNVVISGEQGNIFGNSATLNVKTGDVFISKSSGIVNDGTHR